MRGVFLCLVDGNQGRVIGVFDQHQPYAVLPHCGKTLAFGRRGLAGDCAGHEAAHFFRPRDAAGVEIEVHVVPGVAPAEAEGAGLGLDRKLEQLLAGETAVGADALEAGFSGRAGDELDDAGNDARRAVVAGIAQAGGDFAAHRQVFTVEGA